MRANVEHNGLDGQKRSASLIEHQRVVDLDQLIKCGSGRKGDIRHLVGDPPTGRGAGASQSFARGLHKHTEILTYGVDLVDVDTVYTVLVRSPAPVTDEPRARSVLVEGYGRCVLNEKGYLRIWHGPLRKQYLHRAVWERIAGHSVPAGFTVHHIASKYCWCPHNLVALGPGLHVHERPRCPYTGRILSVREYELLHGVTVAVGL